MNQFVVPQFIDTEAKIFGPVTVRQFVFVFLGVFLVAIARKAFGNIGFAIVFLIVAIVVFLFGFFKVNGRSFHLFFISVLETIRRPSVRVWRSSPNKEIIIESGVSKLASREDGARKPRMDKSRLKELTLIVDTGGLFKR